MAKMYRRDVRRQVIEAWQAGMPEKEIQAKWGPTRGTVHNWTRGMVRSAVPFDRRESARKMDPAIALQMEDNGMRRCEIARKFGVSPAAVTQALRKHLGLQPVARGSRQSAA